MSQMRCNDNKSIQGYFILAQTNHSTMSFQHLDFLFESLISENESRVLPQNRQTSVLPMWLNPPVRERSFEQDGLARGEHNSADRAQRDI